MKGFTLTLCLLAALPWAADASFFDDDAPAPLSAQGAAFETAFTSGNAGVSPAVVKEILSAKKSIRMAARDFTSKPVSEALVKAARDGVKLEVVLDRKANDNVYSAAQFLLAMSRAPHVTKGDGALYSDYIIVDDRDVVLGNISGFADEVDEQKNAASVLIIHNAPALAAQYLANWQTLWAASEEMKKGKD